MDDACPRLWYSIGETGETKGDDENGIIFHINSHALMILTIVVYQMGLRNIDYWKVTYIYSAAVYLVVLFVVYLCGIIFNFGVISHTRYGR